MTCPNPLCDENCHDCLMREGAAFAAEYTRARKVGYEYIGNVEARHHGIVRFCDDCKAVPPTTTWGLGTVRCTPCSETFRAKIQAERDDRDRREREALEAHQAAGCPDDGVTCPECCEHEYDWDEGGMCLNCGDQGDFGAVIDFAMETYGGDR